MDSFNRAVICLNIEKLEHFIVVVHSSTALDEVISKMLEGIAFRIA